MTLSDSFRFFLHEAIDIERIRHLLPQDVQVEYTEEIVGEVLLRDTFTCDVRLAGRLLVQAGDLVWLLDPTRSMNLRQSCKTAWRFVPELPGGKVKECLHDVSPLRAFLPMGTRNLRIGHLALLDDETKTRVRASVYIFEQDGKRVTLGQTQPIKGYHKAYQALVDVLGTQGMQALSIGQDLYTILGGAGRIYHAKPEIPLKPDAPASETVRQIIGTFLQVARENEPGIMADYDTEFLHDYRVSLRKVRSMLSLCKGVYSAPDTTRLKQAFAGIMKGTNRLRDLDVYLLEQERFFSLVPESLHDGLHVMFATFRTERQAQQAHVAEMLASSTYIETMRELTAQFQTSGALEDSSHAIEPTLTFARRLIWKRYHKVSKFADCLTADTPDHEVHRLRIQCKKLRYLMEFFNPLFPKKSMKQLIKVLKRLQDNLGHFNDDAVQQRSLQAFLQEYAHQHTESLKLAESVGALITVLHQHQFTERQQIMENFEAFNSVKTRSVFSTLFAEKGAS